MEIYNQKQFSSLNKPHVNRYEQRLSQLFANTAKQSKLFSQEELRKSSQASAYQTFCLGNWEKSDFAVQDWERQLSRKARMFLAAQSLVNNIRAETWNCRYLSQESIVLNFVCQLIEEEQAQAIVKLLSTSPEKAKASSSAATVMARLQIPFPTDMQQMQLPFADLSGASLAGRNFSNANLRKALLEGVHFDKSHFLNTDMKGADFGESPLLALGNGSYKLCCHHPTLPLLALLKGDTSVELWDTEKLQKLQTINGQSWWRRIQENYLMSAIDKGLGQGGMPGHIDAIVFSQDGSRLLTGNRYGEASLWNVTSGELLDTFHHSLSRWVGAVALSPSGDQLITGESGHPHWGDISCSVRVWNSSPPHIVFSEIFDGSIQCVTFDEKARRCAANSGSKISVWLTDGQLLRSWKRKTLSLEIRFGQPDHLLHERSVDGIHTWNIDNGQCLATIKLSPSHFFSRLNLNWTVMAAWDNAVDPLKLVDVATGKKTTPYKVKENWEFSPHDVIFDHTGLNLLILYHHNQLGKMKVVQKKTRLPPLSANGCDFQGAELSYNNRQLLEQRGART